MEVISEFKAKVIEAQDVCQCLTVPYLSLLSADSSFLSSAPADSDC